MVYGLPPAPQEARHEYGSLRMDHDEHAETDRIKVIEAIIDARSTSVAVASV